MDRKSVSGVLNTLGIPGAVISFLVHGLRPVHHIEESPKIVSDGLVVFKVIGVDGVQFLAELVIRPHHRKCVEARKHLFGEKILSGVLVLACHGVEAVGGVLPRDLQLGKRNCASLRGLELNRVAPPLRGVALLGVVLRFWFHSSEACEFELFGADSKYGSARCNPR